MYTLACLLVLAAAPEPQPAPRGNTFSLNTIGALGFLRHNVGSFGAGYEHVFARRHGLVLEGNFVHVHGHPTHVWTFGGNAGYRIHLPGPRGSAFFGALVGYKAGFGKHTLPDDAGLLRVGVTQVFAGLHAGYRWIWSSGFTFTIRLGAGYGPYRVRGKNAPPGAAAGLVYVGDVLGTTPVAIDSELGIGYSF